MEGLNYDKPPLTPRPTHPIGLMNPKALFKAVSDEQAVDMLVRKDRDYTLTGYTLTDPDPDGSRFLSRGH